MHFTIQTKVYFTVILYCKCTVVGGEICGDRRAQATRRVAKGFGPAQVKAFDKCVVLALWMSEYGTLKYEWCQIFGSHHTFYIICAVRLTTLSVQILPDLCNRYVPKVQRK